MLFIIVFFWLLWWIKMNILSSTYFIHWQTTKIYNNAKNAFYRAMHFSAKRGIAIACRLSVRLSVCDVGELWSHRLEFFEINFTVS